MYVKVVNSATDMRSGQEPREDGHFPDDFIAVPSVERDIERIFVRHSMVGLATVSNCQRSLHMLNVQVAINLLPIESHREKSDDRG